MKSDKKILLIDGIGGIPLGKELAECFRSLGVETTHLNALKAPTRPAYRLASPVVKAYRRFQEGADGFYCFPKMRESHIEDIIFCERPSHILVLGFAYKFCAPATLRRLASKYGARLILYDTDSCNLYSKRREFVFFLQQELPIYEQIFSFSKVTTRFFADTLKLPADYLPFGAVTADPPAPCAKDIDALFVGSGDLRRIFLLEHIRNSVKVRGSRWSRNFPLMSEELRQNVDDRPVWGRELAELQARAKIIINITRTDFYGAETGINLRIFEALAAGAFLLTDYCDEIGELFDEGRHLETFRSSAELAEKLDHYLRDDESRTRIARQGHAVFLEKHTWFVRLSEMLDKI